MAELRPNMTPYFGVYKSLFKFGGLPAPLTPDALVRLVFYNEYIAFTRVGTAVVAGSVATHTPNMYGEPGADVYVCFERAYPTVRRKRNEVVILDLSIGDHDTPYTTIYNAAKIIEEIDLAIKLNIKAHQIPAIWGVGNKDMKDEIMRLLAKVRDTTSDPIVIDAASSLFTSLKSIKADTPFIVSNLQAAKAQAKSELYSLIGVNYAALQKVSNAVVDEINANANIANIVYKYMFDRWETAFRECNEKFGTKMTVEKAIEDKPEPVKTNPNEEDKPHE